MKWISVIAVALLFSFFHLTTGDINSLHQNSIYYGLVEIADSFESVHSQCVQKLSRIAQGIRDKEIWAIKLYDASGAPRTGAYWGNMYWLGSRKQCLSVYSGQEPMLNTQLLPITRESPNTLVPFPVDYFSAFFYHNSTIQMFVHWQNETKITLGLCLPSVCTPLEISDLLQKYFDTGKLSYQQLYGASFTMHEVRKTNLKIDMEDPMSRIFYVWSLLAIVICIVGTFYDVTFHQPSLKQKSHSNSEVNGHHLNGFSQNSTKETTNGLHALSNPKEELNIYQKILIGCSWYTNFKTIFTTKVNSGSLVPIAGLRFLLTNFIIFSHSYVFMMDYYDNRTNIFMYSESLIGQIFQNSSYGVDVFFFLGGFLMVYTLSTSKELKDAKSLSNWQIFKLFLRGVYRRFRRLTPVYLYIILMVATVSTIKAHVCSFWTNERNDIQCNKYWWTNVIYINNLYPGTFDKMCMSWTWYLACDMQFFVVSSFLYLLSRKYFKMALFLTLTVMVGCFVATGVMAYLLGYRPYIDQFYQMAPYFYYPPWVRINQYIVGALYGYLYRKINGRLEINKLYIYLFWILSIAIITYLEYGFADKNFSIVKAVLHAALSRTMFVVGFGWIIFACLTGHGGFFNTILVAEGWRPFSQLTYTAYLINPIVVFTLVTGAEGAWEFQERNILLIGNGLIVITYMVSLLIVLCVEIPIDKFINIVTGERPTRFQIVDQTMKIEQSNGSSQRFAKSSNEVEDESIKEIQGMENTETS